MHRDKLDRCPIVSSSPIDSHTFDTRRTENSSFRDLNAESHLTAAIPYSSHFLSPLSSSQSIRLPTPASSFFAATSTTTYCLILCSYTFIIAQRTDYSTVDLNTLDQRLSFDQRRIEKRRLEKRSVARSGDDIRFLGI